MDGSVCVEGLNDSFWCFTNRFVAYCTALCKWEWLLIMARMWHCRARLGPLPAQHGAAIYVICWPLGARPAREVLGAHFRLLCRFPRLFPKRPAIRHHVRREWGSGWHCSFIFSKQDKKRVKPLRLQKRVEIHSSVPLGFCLDWFCRLYNTEHHRFQLHSNAPPTLGGKIDLDLDSRDPAEKCPHDAF